MRSAVPTRVLRGHVLPSPGIWDIDRVRTEVAFVGGRPVAAKVGSRSRGVTGTVRIAEDLDDSRVDLAIEMADAGSVGTVHNAHVRDVDPSEIEQFTEATFQSTEVVWNGSRGAVRGNLTIRGISRGAAVEVAFDGYTRDPSGDNRAIFSARTQVDREDAGTEGVRLEIVVEAVLRRT